MATELNALIKTLRQFTDERDWTQFHSPKNLASALAVEAGELLEHFQWQTEAQSRALAPDKVEEVARELADVFLFLLFPRARSTGYFCALSAIFPSAARTRSTPSASDSCSR